MKNQLISGLISTPVVSALILACGLHLLPAAMEKGHAQEIVDYRFSGNHFLGDPDAFGSHVTGNLSLVPDAIPDAVAHNGTLIYQDQIGFGIELSFDNGFQITENQVTYVVFVSHLADDGNRRDMIQFVTEDYFGYLIVQGISSNNTPGVPDPWQLEDYVIPPQGARLSIRSRHEKVSATFELTDLSPFNPISNLIIGGVDSGTLDFEVDWAGEVIWASEALEMIADSSRNHGQFVSRMAKFFNLALKQDLISEEQKDYLTSLVAESK